MGVKRFIIFLITCVVCFACQKEDITPAISVDLENNKNIPTINIGNIIPIESVQNSIIGEIRSLSFAEDNIYILDTDYSKSLYQFNLNGRFRNKTILGKGPGELIDPIDFYIDSDNEQIMIWDATLKQMNRFDMDLNYLSNSKENLVLRNFRM
ncbi:MAG: 6-bladed beta-propeller, partial [bacterium]|nr:6-bladed beta-propeller [bacterium]